METMKRTLFQKYIGNETKSLIDALVASMSAFESKEAGVELQRSIIKVGMKVAVLYKQKLITSTMFKDLRLSFRKFCACFTNGYRLDRFPAAFPRLCALGLQFESELFRILGPLVSKKFLGMIGDLTKNLTSEEFLEHTWTNCPQQFKEMAFTLVFYLELTRDD
eukprot:TRINITY_DN21380_c0_g1_i1.p1 TRINITY_DN21380_c0_g1~~TRINITY_DN21380_c0_g1_i1.p1  ORF type:complete len:164 (-),score=23.55 TRINITY_DN21380_c0_g1_i1:145-636(-)